MSGLRAGPLHRALAFLDPLLGSTALVIELHDVLGRAIHVCDDEANAREQLRQMPFDLTNLTELLVVLEREIPEAAG
jgi:hypothetical protein